MDSITLYEHQKRALKLTEGFNKCAYYLDRYGSRKNVCRK